ncbi:MAG: hypothetical protein LBV04_08750 [Deferribacteraceae bacterium]|jgi:hypothetical protein|nr:hypothetical protein [Deferribacteraceae bacterium]
MQYPLTPRKISASAVQLATVRVKFEESSYEQRIATRSTPQRIFKLDHTWLTAAEEQQLIDFFTACQGAVKAFSFFNYLDGNTYNCRFKADELRFDRINKQFANVSLELETC